MDLCNGGVVSGFRWTRELLVRKVHVRTELDLRVDMGSRIVCTWKMTKRLVTHYFRYELLSIQASSEDRLKDGRPTILSSSVSGFRPRVCFVGCNKAATPQNSSISRSHLPDTRSFATQESDPLFQAGLRWCETPHRPQTFATSTIPQTCPGPQSSFVAPTITQNR